MLKFFLNFDLKDKFLFSLIFVLFFLIGFFDVITIATIPIILSYVISPDVILSYIPDGNLKNYLSNYFGELTTSEKLSIFSVIIILSFIIKNIIVYSIYYFETLFLKKLTTRFQNIVFLSYVKKNYSDFMNYSYSEIIRDYNFASQAVTYLRSFLVVFKEVVIIIGLFITVLIVEIDFLFYVIFLLILTFFFQRYLSSFVKNWGNQVALFRKKIFEVIRENYDLFLETKISNKDEYFHKSFERKINVIEGNVVKTKLISYFYKPFFEVLFTIIIVVCVIFMYEKNYSMEQIIPFIALLVFSTARIMPSINSLLINYNSIKFNEKPSSIVFQKINELKKINYLNYKKKIKSINFIDEIKVSNLNYKVGNSEIIKNINLKINKNDKVAFFGKVGSGKTTTLKILSGLITFNRGEIKIDNKFTLKPNQRFLWNNSSYFKQNAALLNETIKNNILFLNNFKLNKKNYNKLIKSLGIKENIFKNNKDFLKKVGFLGSKISGGQKQITALARVFNKKNNIVFLDEPTNNLDIRIKRKVINFLKNYYGTLIVVTHDKEILKVCNKIYEFKGGKAFLKKNYN